MSLTFLSQVVATIRWIRSAVAGSVICLLAACQTMGEAIPAAEFVKFTPKSQDQRIMKEVLLRWEVRADAAQICAKSVGRLREQAYSTPPVACAIWHVANKECVVITGSQTSHVALGHEVRHCFEGHFHD